MTRSGAFAFPLLEGAAGNVVRRFRRWAKGIPDYAINRLSIGEFGGRSKRCPAQAQEALRVRVRKADCRSGSVRYLL